MTAKRTAIDDLIDQVGVLCAIYVGKDAPSEPWIDTCRRLIEIDKTLKRVRRLRKTVAPKTEKQTA